MPADSSRSPLRRLVVTLLSICALLLWAAAGCAEGADTSQTSSAGGAQSTTSATQTTTTTASLGPGLGLDILEAILEFVDVPLSHPYYMQITDLDARGIISGFLDGTFKAESWITRQQFTKMVAKTMGYPVSESDICPFVDVQSNLDVIDPLYPDHYVAVCAERGITVGITDSTFAPDDSITRAQLITMVARAANLVEPPEGYGPPFGQFDSTHFPFARRAAYAGLLDGLLGLGPDYDFLSPATRGEVCVILFNLLHNQLQK
jgi:hypothetical protein